VGSERPEQFRRRHNIRETGVICRTRTSYQMIECKWFQDGVEVLGDGRVVITD